MEKAMLVAFASETLPDTEHLRPCLVAILSTCIAYFDGWRGLVLPDLVPSAAKGLAVQVWHPAAEGLPV